MCVKKKIDMNKDSYSSFLYYEKEKTRTIIHSLCKDVPIMLCVSTIQTRPGCFDDKLPASFFTALEKKSQNSVEGQLNVCNDFLPPFPLSHLLQKIPLRSLTGSFFFFASCHIILSFIIIIIIHALIQSSSPPLPPQHLLSYTILRYKEVEFIAIPFTLAHCSIA